MLRRASATLAGLAARWSHAAATIPCASLVVQHTTSLCAPYGAMTATSSRWFRSLPSIHAAASSASVSSTSPASPAGEFVALNTIRDNPGAYQSIKRLGRGIGSGKGKTSGRGHKGQRARSGGGPKAGFEGGQVPLRLRVPKRGFHNPFTREYQVLNLAKLASWVEQGRLDASRVITMKELRDSGAVGHRIGHGVKLLAAGQSALKTPLHLEVSVATQQAREAIAKAGGSVTTVYYNELGLRALTMPEWFAKKGRLLPRAARCPPKLEGKFDRLGELPPKREVVQTSAA